MRPTYAQKTALARSEREVAVEITAATVRRGDIIVIGGVPMRIANLRSLPGGAKRVEFAEGLVFTLPARVVLTALRVAGGW